MYFEYDAYGTGNEPYLINLIDSPGHVDFSSEVTAALRVTDGALVVVDSVEGVCVQTGTVLRQSMTEKIRPVLMVNKVDRLLLELKLDSEQIYQNFIRVIDMVNVILSTYQCADMEDLLIYPTKGNVAFGSGKECWAFTLTHFARLYSVKFGIDQKKLMQRLWGDNYFDPETKKWITDNISESGKPLKRAFCAFIMEPITKITKAVMDGDLEQLDKICASIQLELKQDEKKEVGKKLLKVVLSKWINAADILLEMMILHLPSPKEAQKYRAAYLYEGPENDVIC